MIALDTNVVVRLLVDDDEKQVNKAKKVLEKLENSGETALIPNLVLLETIWVLESGYDADRKEIIAAVEQLTTVPVFSFEDVDLIHRFTQEGKAQSTDLSDILIGLTAQKAECTSTLTFDKKAAKNPLFKEL
jgi:predicted nucleic-acid-binding protein